MNAILYITLVLFTGIVVSSNTISQELDHMVVTPHTGTVKIRLSTGEVRTFTSRTPRPVPKDPDYIYDYYDTIDQLYETEQITPADAEACEGCPTFGPTRKDQKLTKRHTK